MRISDWSSDVCSSDLECGGDRGRGGPPVASCGCVASVRHVLRPVRLDLLDQFVRQRHVVERLGLVVAVGVDPRSEEHTSELQSLMRISYAVFCLKKKNTHNHHPCKVDNPTYYSTVNMTIAK